MSVRHVVSFVVCCSCLILASAAEVQGQLRLDHLQLANAGASSDLIVTSSDIRRTQSASQEVLQSLPANYLESKEDQTPSIAPRRGDDAIGSRRLANWLVLGGLASAFGFGLVVTVATIRSQSSRSMPKPLF